MTDITPPPPFDSADRSDTAVFENAWLVQLVSPDPLAADARVEQLVPMTVGVRSDRVTADGDGLDWLWLAEDVDHVVHAHDASWTIFAVPGIDSFGVAVDPADTVRFSRSLAEVTQLPGRTQARPADSPLESAAPGPVGWAPPAAAVAPAVGAAIVGADDRPDTDQAPAPMVQPERPGKRGRRRARGGVALDPTTAHPGGLAALEARSISAWFGDHLVLDRVSLHMPAGQVTALIGPSGCGKSTFLRILNRMHEMIPSAAMAGEVILDGHDIYSPSRKVTDARVEVGMVFQKPNPFPAMSIYDNVVASLRVTGTKASTEVKDQLVESCLSKAGLWNEVKDRLRQPGGGLSGGQQQRLCIARALAIKPRVLLMDEPCSALDPTSTRRIEETISELVSEVTIVIVTHNMQQAARVSDQCAFFLAEHNTPGYIVEHGPTGAMFGSPQDPRTNDYVNGRFG